MTRAAAAGWRAADRDRQILLAAGRSDRQHHRLIARVEAVGNLQTDLEVTRGLSRPAAVRVALGGLAADRRRDRQRWLGNHIGGYQAIHAWRIGLTFAGAKDGDAVAGVGGIIE